jgi:hypothetical protein
MHILIDVCTGFHPLNADNMFPHPWLLISNLNMIEQSSFIKKMPWMFNEENGHWAADLYNCFLQ